MPVILRLPLGNTGSVWAGTRITTTLNAFDGTPRQPQIGSITPTNDGNVFLIGCSPPSNVAIAAVSTFGTATTTVPAGTNYSPPQIFRFQDTNGTFSNYGAITGTSTTTATRQFGPNNTCNGIVAAKLPGSNDSIRVMSTANFPDLTINGVAAANLNTSNTTYIPVRFDISSANVITNFKGQLPVTSTGQFYITPVGMNSTLNVGPSPDSTNVVGLLSSGYKVAKMDNLNV
jgi:hypothetical protein